MRRFAFTFASALLLATLTGCGHIQVLLHTRVQLATVPVQDVAVRMANDPGIAPGERDPLIATFTDATGKVWTTEGAGRGKVLWSDIQVTPTLVNVKKGVVTLAHDPRLSDGKIAHVSLAVPSHPTLHAELDIPLRYDYPFVAAYSGTSGNNGLDGTTGSDGISGSPGSTDPNNPSPGGDGTSGGNGGDGSNGSDGGDGPDVTARVTLRPGPHPLLQAEVSANNKNRFYLIDPSGGSLTISSSGGSGGRGGAGGKGGRGGAGGIGTPNGSSGSDGLAGHDGLNGSDGRPGTVTITYDPSVVPYLGAIHTGRPAAKMIESPVSPLW